jgi:hypothetical protein
VVGVAEEDEAEDGSGIFRGLQFGVGAKLVSGSPQALLQIRMISGHWKSFYEIPFR